MPTDVWPLLRRRFPAGEYALLREVRNEAGHAANRSADGIAMNLYPSRGLEVHGIEIKSHRNDWLREIKQPAKAEAFFKYCDRWWLVTADETVAKLEEIPDTWGWLVAKGDRLYTKKEAPKLTPEPLTRSFIASMFKRVTQGMVHKSELDDKVQELVNEEVDRKMRYQTDWERQYNDLKKVVDAFEQASGVEINNGWGGVSEGWRIGAAVRAMLQEDGRGSMLSRMERLAAEAEGIHTFIQERVKLLKADQKSCIATPQTT